MNAKKITAVHFFRLDVLEGKILGTKTMLAKANKGYGPVYDELMALMAEHPTFDVTVKRVKEPANKQTHKGMDITFMRDWLTAIGDNETLETMNNVIAFAEKTGKSKYPLAKHVLLDAYKYFNFAEAKSCVADYRYKQTINSATSAKAKPMTDNNTVIGEGEENELKPVVNL